MDIGTITCDLKLIDAVVEALNYLKECKRLRFLCTMGKVDKNTLRFKTLLAGGTAERAAVESALGSESVVWRSVEGSLANPDIFKVERRLKASNTARLLTKEDLLPADEVGNPFFGLIGMEAQTRCVKEIATAIEAYGREALDSLGMVFVGSPGTGKTELARRLAQYCRQRKINTGKLVHASAATLISNHVGETPLFVNNAFEEAKDGILFIDEAYSLTEGEGNEFGQEAVNQLVECLDRCRRDVMVVAAGYPDEMDRFLSANPGLRDRFGFRVEFPDYTDEQLSDIFYALAEAKQFSLANDLRDDLAECVSELRRRKGFSNARSVRNLLDKAIIEAAQNHPSKRGLDCHDVKAAVAKLGTERSSNETIIGFA